jgi:hypothetical protein
MAKKTAQNLPDPLRNGTILAGTPRRFKSVISNRQLTEREPLSHAAIELSLFTHAVFAC